MNLAIQYLIASNRLYYAVRHRTESGTNVVTFHATSESAEVERRWRKASGAKRVRKIRITRRFL